MKRISFVVVAAFALTALTVNAADSTRISGWISDSTCGARHAGTGADCVKKCVAGGQKPVFVDQGKNVWTIDNPEAVSAFLGDKVSVTATTDDAAKSVHIDAIQAIK